MISCKGLGTHQQVLLLTLTVLIGGVQHLEGRHQCGGVGCGGTQHKHGFEKNYRQLCGGRLPHPAESECVCAAVLLCDGKIQISIFALFGFIVQFCMYTILAPYCPLTRRIYEKNDELCVK